MVAIVVAVVKPLRDAVMTLVPISVTIGEPVREGNVIYLPITNRRRDAEFDGQIMRVDGDIGEAPPDQYDAEWEGGGGRWHRLSRGERGRLTLAEWHPLWSAPGVVVAGPTEDFVFRLRRAVGQPVNLHLVGQRYEDAADHVLRLRLRVTGRNRRGQREAGVELGCAIVPYGPAPHERYLNPTARLLP
ncbi:MAG: hypothetical protein ACLQGJ_04595 [Candidatus Dormibacteria bacterium]